MAAWKEITQDDVLAGLNKRERDALMQGLDDSASKIDDIIEDVVNQCRRYIAGCDRNVLGPEGKLAPSCVHHAISIIVWRLFSRNAFKSVPDSIEKSYEDANRFFRDVARCLAPIEEPDDPAPSTEQTKASGIKQVNKPKRIFTRESMKGL